MVAELPDISRGRNRAGGRRSAGAGIARQGDVQEISDTEHSGGLEL